MATIDKALSLLDLFSENRPEIGLTEIKSLSGFDKGTTHRYLSTLRDCGFLEQNQSTKAYRLGPAVIRLAMVREKTVPRAHIAAEYIDSLASDIKELVHISVPQARGMTSLYAKDGGSTGTRVGFNPSELLPYHATSSGLSMLAFGPARYRKNHAQQDLTRFTRRTLSEQSALAQKILATQEQGYARADQSFENEVSSIAIPFFDSGDAAAGSISIATPTSRMKERLKETYLAGLISVSRAFSSDIGGKVPDVIEKKWAKLT